MRKFTVLLLLLFVPVLVIARTTWFGDYESLLDNISDGRDVAAVDIDGDGDDDIVLTAFSGATGNVKLLVNIGGGFISTVVDPNFYGATDIEVGDLDGDGDMDIVVGGETQVRWYPNTQGSFLTVITLTSSYDQCRGLHVVDMNGDGYLDIAVSSYGDDGIGWFENDGSANFTNHLVSSSCNGAFNVNGADLDNDGDMDLVASAYIDDELVWYENIGGMVFSAAQVLASDLNGIHGIATGDFEGDGDIDISVAVNIDDQFLLFQNNGNATFTMLELEYMATGAWDMLMYDIDEDGDEDIFGFAQYEHDAQWYEYDQGGQSMEHTIDSDLLGFFGMTIGYFDGDDIPDVAGMRYNAGDQNEVICWYGSRTEDWTEHAVSFFVIGASDVKVADFDGDGDLDVVGAADGMERLYMFENVGDNVFQKTIISEFSGVYAIHVADIDDNLLPDILVASSDADMIRLFRNIGNMQFFEVVVDPFLGEVESVDAADMDGDGDLDVLGAGHSDDVVAWYENTGTVFVKNIIDQNLNGAADVVGVDLDQDGDMDVLACGDFEDVIVWYENIGSEVFVQHEVAGLQDGVKAAQYGDLDGDGDLDVAAAVNVANEVAWYENDGNMSFTYHLVQSDFTNAFVVEIDDIDGDGSLDIAASSANGDTLAWFANDGVGNFTMNLIDGDFEGPRGIQIVDMNGDGLKDLIAASHYEGQMAWWENMFGIPPDPISIELTPDEPVIIIAENGGSFDYTATIDRFGPTQTFDAWTTVTYVPNGNAVITAEFHNLPIQPGTHQYSLSQYIPGLAPAGDYLFSAYLGSFPWIGEVYDSFSFSKEGVMTADFSVFDEAELWPTIGAIGEATETVLQNDSDTELPSEYALYDAYPNPFNPSTSISVALPENAVLQVTIYNALGQQVTELVNRRMSAGVHGFTFDASDQPSGLYFIHAMVPGQFTDVKKVMLVK